MNEQLLEKRGASAGNRKQMQQAKIAEKMAHNQILINGRKTSAPGYLQYHRKRIAVTIEKLREISASKIVEIGGHPWEMTAALIDNPEFELCATVSAEEVTNWPDDIGVKMQQYQIRTVRGNEACVINYSANIERTLFDLDGIPDTVLACEIVEHLIRSPHIMFLNINRWLPVSGKLLVTTPNGAQFSNPFRRKSSTPAYRCNVYERHSYVYKLDEITELITLCGFKVLEAGYWDVYERNGFSTVYGMLSYIPFRYCQDKFEKLIYVVGKKEKEVTELERCPKVYDPRGDWEYITQGDKD